MTMREETIQLFVDDTREHLRLIEIALLQCRQAGGDHKAMAVVVDSIHKVGGAAAVFGFKQLADFLQSAERVLQRRSPHIHGIDASCMTLLLDVAWHIDDLLELIRTGSTPSERVHDNDHRLRARLDAEMEALQAA